MHAFGIRGEALGVISSYLTNRHQFVRFDRVKSELLAVKSGVPQGSIVGRYISLFSSTTWFVKSNIHYHIFSQMT